MIYVCEYDNSTDSRLLLKAAGCFFQKEQLFSGIEIQPEGVQWVKLRERILAWLLLEYALQKGAAVEILREDCKACGTKAALGGRLCKSIVDKLEIKRTEFGKPYSSRYPELFFNISHCDTACACAIGAQSVGIDVERRFAENEKLMRYICCEQELEVLLKLPSKQAAEQLRMLWSMKEAFVKMDGRGLGYGLKNLDLSSFLPIMEQNWQNSVKDCFFEGKRAENYTLVCCSREKAKENIMTLSEQELIWQLAPVLTEEASDEVGIC